MALNQAVEVGKTSLTGVNLIFDDLAGFRKSFGRQFDGIIGNALLSQYKTEINFDQHQFYLYRFDTPLNLDGYQAVPFEFKNGIPIPQFDIEVKINGKNYQGTILFDSGAGLALLFNAPFAEEHQLPNADQKRLTSYSQNLSKTSVPKDFMVEELHFGGYTFKDFIVSASTDKAGVSAIKSYLGIMGRKLSTVLTWCLITRKKYFTLNRIPCLIRRLGCHSQDLL
ncbi:aspartyl protease family protein [Riemerella columbina]|uniref:aspartyl protease family protein n=1 Tax=Riemerella columbina TaxID=103810 RepID=UPI00266F9023|nr:aspartyl protease family protein [Riemerella columbina]WKS94545.1 hypothetical protein NYR17_06290 [Riemerella columbina]